MSRVHAIPMLAALAAGLAACGGASAAGTGTAAVTPPAFPQYVGAMAIDSGSSTESVSLISPADKRVVAHVQLPALNPAWTPLATVNGLYFLGPAGIERLNPDGSTTDLAPLTVAQQNSFSGLAVSPDGSTIVYGLTTINPNATVTTVLYTETGTAAPKTIGPYTRALQSGATLEGGYTPLAWTAAGVIMGTDPVNIGRSGPFATGLLRHSVISIFDPKTLAMTEIGTPAGCLYGDMATNGTIACVATDSAGAVSLKLVPHTGSPTTVSLPGAAAAGDIHFLPGTDNVVFSTADSSGAYTGWLLAHGSTTPTKLAKGCAVTGALGDEAVCQVPAAASVPPGEFGTDVAVVTRAGQITTLASLSQAVGTTG